MHPFQCDWHFRNRNTICVILNINTNHWSSGLSVSITRHCGRYTICVCTARRPISFNIDLHIHFAARHYICLIYLFLTYSIDYATNIHSWNWKLVPFDNSAQMGLAEKLSVIISLIWALRLYFGCRPRSSNSMMLSFQQFWKIRNHGSAKWKLLIQSTISSS